MKVQGKEKEKGKEKEAGTQTLHFYTAEGQQDEEFRAAEEEMVRSVQHWLIVHQREKDALPSWETLGQLHSKSDLAIIDVSRESAEGKSIRALVARRLEGAKLIEIHRIQHISRHEDYKAFKRNKGID